MIVLRSVTRPLKLSGAILLIICAAICFHLAYLQTNFGFTRLCIIGYLICLVQLARLSTTRQAFYAGLATGLLCVGPQLTCFWQIFGPAAIALWAVLALWIAAFTGITRATLTRFGPVLTMVLIPFFWMGLEYFRSELYYLKFSWLNVGYAFSDWHIFSFRILGMYGVGFFVAICGALFLALRPLFAVGGFVILFAANAFFADSFPPKRKLSPRLNIAGIQMEFPAESDIAPALDSTLKKYPDANILVLSEYTLDGPVPGSLKDWCRSQQRYLVVGGKDPASNNNFYDTAFVVGTNGEVVFHQAKCVPIQFFKDGLPAPEQEVWNSPWGKIGFCICYDLSYTRVTDRLIREGAGLLIVPTMDLMDWGEHQHQLHARVAPVRAAEYGIPIFRLASSGISQSVSAIGNERSRAPFPGQGETLFASFPPLCGGSVPIDRFLAPLAVAVTGVTLLLLWFWKPNATTIPIIPEPEHKSEPPETVDKMNLPAQK